MKKERELSCFCAGEADEEDPSSLPCPPRRARMRTRREEIYQQGSPSPPDLPNTTAAPPGKAGQRPSETFILSALVKLIIMRAVLKILPSHSH